MSVVLEFLHPGQGRDVRHPATASANNDKQPFKQPARSETLFHEALRGQVCLMSSPFLESDCIKSLKKNPAGLKLPTTRSVCGQATNRFMRLHSESRDGTVWRLLHSLDPLSSFVAGLQSSKQQQSVGENQSARALVISRWLTAFEDPRSFVCVIEKHDGFE